MSNENREKETEIDSLPHTQDINLELDKLHPVFKDYWLQFKGRVESSKEYVLASLLTELGELIGNKAKLKIGFGIVPNFYTVLVGNSTFMRKSVSMDLGTMYLRALSEQKKEKYLSDLEKYREDVERYETLSKKDKEHTPKPVKPADTSYIYPKECSPEQLLVKLSEKPDGIFIYSELGNLLSRLESGYMAGFKEKLTEFYDGREERYDRELKSGEIIQIKGAAPSLLACSTFQWLQKHLTDLDLLSGFLARFLFVCRRSYSELEIAIQPFYAIEEYWLDFHQEVAKFEATLTLSKEAEESYIAWYSRFRKWAIDQDELVHSFLGRLLTACHKIATVNHVLEFVYCSGDLRYCSKEIIQAKAYELAYPWVDFFSKNIMSCYGELTQKTNVSEMRVLEIIRKFGEDSGNGEKRLAMRNVARRSKMTKKELLEVVETLEMKGLLKVETKKTYTFFTIKG